MGAEEIVQVNWVFMAGSWYQERKPEAAAVNFLLKNGTTEKNAFEINEHFEYYGAFLNRAAYSETAEITLHCLNKHFRELIPVVAELVTSSVLPEEELRLYIQNSIQRLQVNLKKCDFIADRRIDASLFGSSHPYGSFTEVEDYSALDRESLLAFYDRYYRNGRCVIFVSGKIPEGLVEELDKHFGTLPLQNHRANAVKPSYSLDRDKQRVHKIINDPDGVQAAIRMARPFPGRDHPDFQKVQVLNTVFGGFFGSRLMANIREDKGYTYGIYSYLLNHNEEGAWKISTEAGRDVSEATIAEVYNEMERLRSEPVDSEELQMTKNYLIGTILGDLDGPFQVIARWRNLVLHGQDEEFFNRGVSIIRSITAEELQALAQKYLEPDAFYEIAVI
jgi:predicted Zn-dependent peptidase